MNRRKRRKPSYGFRQLSFGERRMIAKEICQKKPTKLICADWKISASTVTNIKKEFVIITLTERYPDETAGQFELIMEGMHVSQWRNKGSF